VRIELVGPADPAEMTIGRDAGRPVFKGDGTLWRIDRTGDHPGAERFAEWLASEIGQRTVTSYEVAGHAPFTLPGIAEEVEAATDFDGDAAAGKRVSLAQCGRCHVVAPENRMNAMGSTPSFAVLRTMPDWAARFQSFYVLKPHPAFTQVEEVTAPFPIDRPSPIVPVKVTLDEVEAILAYVAEMPPADLGAPLQFQ
jgi:mono/diheme cytochrome c family protein